MTSFSTQQIHDAIYRAAARIEREPKSLDHGRCLSSYEDSGGVCMMIHVGLQLGMTGAFAAPDVAKACGEPVGCDEANDLRMIDFVSRSCGYDHVKVRNDGHRLAPIMRAYADKFYPQTKALSTWISQPVVSWDKCDWRPSSATPTPNRERVT